MPRIRTWFNHKSLAVPIGSNARGSIFGCDSFICLGGSRLAFGIVIYKLITDGAFGIIKSLHNESILPIEMRFGHMFVPFGNATNHDFLLMSSTTGAMFEMHVSSALDFHFERVIVEFDNNMIQFIIFNIIIFNLGKSFIVHFIGIEKRRFKDKSTKVRKIC